MNPAAAAPAPLRALIEAQGTPLLSLVPIETLRTRRAASVFRLAFADGSLCKGRQLESEARAVLMARLTALAGRDVSQVLARHGDCVLEEWVDGDTLAHGAALDPVLAQRSGALLGRLHRLRVDEADGQDGVAPAEAAIERRLDLARSLGVLDAPTLRRIRAVVGEHRPARASVGLIHLDFCGENLVAGAGDRLASVDNVSLRIAAHDDDLARTWYRWPMTAAGRREFLAGYEGSRSAAACLAHFPFWAVGALLLSLVYRAELGLPSASEPAERLQRLLAALAHRPTGRDLFLH